MKPEDVTTDGKSVVVRPPGRPIETHEFSTAEVAERRVRFMREGLSWVGTPFVDCADVKGPNGGVDCGMLLVRSGIDTGLVEPFDPRPYSPRHMLSSSEEKFIGWLERLGAKETDRPRVGDVLVWQFGRCFCHGGILLSDREIVHAYVADGMCSVSPLRTDLLMYIGVGHVRVPRPVKYFELWGY